MERYTVHDEYMTPSEHGNVVLYTDAQATVEALTKELEEYRGLAEKVGAEKAVSDRDALLAQVKALQAQYSELLEALDCVLAERPLPSGEYVHRVSCNGDRRKPAGTIGISCSCRVGQQQVEALQRERDEAVKALNEKADELHGARKVCADQRVGLKEAQTALDAERAAIEHVARNLVRIVKLPHGEYGVRINQRTYTFISEEAAIIEREWWVDFFVSAFKTARQEALREAARVAVGVLTETAARWDDFADLNEGGIKYTNIGFMRASARRCRDAVKQLDRLASEGG